MNFHVVVLARAQGIYVGLYNMQYLHPYLMEGYREAARALRAIGRDCIQKRIQALEGGQPVPHDILTCILKTASKYTSYT